MDEREELRARRVAIRHILMSKWDPIGVSDTPEAADEYDGYIGGVCDLLDRRATAAEFAAYLRKIETERMGLTNANGEPLLPEENRNVAVSALRMLLASSERERGAVPGRKGFRHWKLFTKYISPAFAKTQQRREEGLCIGCGSSPCKCKNRRRPR